MGEGSAPSPPIALGACSRFRMPMPTLIPLSPTQRGHRWGAQSILLSGLAPLLLLACVGAEAGTSDAAITYHCDGGTFFSAELLGKSARVTTLRNNYLLERRPSSIGHKYSDGRVFFIQD